MLEWRRSWERPFPRTTSPSPSAPGRSISSRRSTRLVSAGVLHTEEDRLAFRHDLIRQSSVWRHSGLHTQGAARPGRPRLAPVRAAPTHGAPILLLERRSGTRRRSPACAGQPLTLPRLSQRLRDDGWCALELLDPVDGRHDEIAFDICRLVLRLVMPRCRRGATRACGSKSAAATGAPQRPGAPWPRQSISRIAASRPPRCPEEESRSRDLEAVERVRLAAEAVSIAATWSESRRGRRHAPFCVEPCDCDDVAIRWVLTALPRCHVARRLRRSRHPGRTNRGLIGTRTTPSSSPMARQEGRWHGSDGPGGSELYGPS